MSNSPTVNDNLFEQPYQQPSSTSTPPQLSTAPASRDERRLPTPLIIPSTSASPPHAAASSTGSSSPVTAMSSSTQTPALGGGPVTGSSSNNQGHTTKRVQWPAELSHHVSITMASPTSPRTMGDKGARAALEKALAEHSAHNSSGDGDDDDTLVKPHRRFGHMHARAPSVSGSEGGGDSRPESTDGDNQERFDEMRDGMEVFVDPGETDGLPNAGGKTDEQKASKQAWNLVKSYQTGSYGFLRNRKNGGFKSGMGDGAREDEEATGDPEKGDKEGEDDEEGKASGVAGFFKKLGNNETPDMTGEGVAPVNPAGGGILSALIALQQQQAAAAAGDTSTLASAATSPSSSRAPSRRGSFDETDEDEEAERTKFILKQRQKRAARGGAWDTMSGVGRSALGGVTTGASMVTSGASYALGGAGQALGLSSKEAKSHRRSESGANSGRGSPITNFIASRSSGDLPLEPPSPGFASPKKRGVVGTTTSQFKKLGSTLGLEMDSSTSRPDAAKSSAGVFGGLMLSAGNIAGAAAPAATKLAPQANRPGYHLSRYSAPDVTARKSGDGRPRSLFDGSSRRSSRDASREDLGELRTSTGTAGSSGRDTPPLTSPPLLQAASKPTSFADKKRPFHLSLKDIPTPSGIGNKLGLHSGDHSPRREGLGDYFAGSKETPEEREQREWEKEKRRRRKAKEKRKQEEVFITQHVAAILARQDFIMKMARSFMMFGAPSHRLEAQIQATARVLEINCQCIYIPGVMLISFGDSATHTSEIKFLKQANGLDLGKLLAAYYVYWKVIHDKISVTEASIELDGLMVAPPYYKLWHHLLIGGLASAAIQPSAFYGSFIDCLVTIPLGMLLVLVQVVVSRNDLYSSLFEIVIACINSFLAAALASTGHFCFSAMASGSVVLILPGYIVLCGSLELANRSIISGSVRLVYSILYSLFLGFGLAMGGEIYSRITGLDIAGATDYTCSALRVGAPWYKAVIPKEVYILSIPTFLLMLALRNGQPLMRKETPIMLVIGSAGFCANYFSGKAFPNRSDISSAIGSFAVGFLGNVYGKFTRGSPFVVMVVGVLVQLPSGLSNGGLLQFASDDDSTSSYNAGFSAAQSLVSVAIGLTVGLFVSAAVVNFAGGGRRRGSNLSSF